MHIYGSKSFLLGMMLSSPNSTTQNQILPFMNGGCHSRLIVAHYNTMFQIGNSLTRKPYTARQVLFREGISKSALILEF